MIKKLYWAKTMSKIVLSSVVLLLLLVTSVQAMCPVMMSPPEQMIMPDDNTHGLLMYSSALEKEILILEPSFHGDAKDFGMVLPLPSRPRIDEAPEELFQELEDLTNPFQRHLTGFETTTTGGEGLASGVRVVEVKDVGDYTVAVLQADTSDSLNEWLAENNYVFTEQDSINFEYYVANGGFYFAAMKVNMENAQVDSEGNLHGKLKPIAFTFSSTKPMLPLRSMASDMEPMAFTLYTLSEEYTYIPGVEIQYAKKVDQKTLEQVPSLKEYNSRGQWLVRIHTIFDPKKIEDDLYLKAGTPVVIRPEDASVVLNPDQLNEQWGLQPAEGFRVVYSDEKSTRSSEEFKGECVPLLPNELLFSLLGGSYGTTKNGVTLVEGKTGAAFSFDGINDYVVIPDGSIGLDLDGFSELTLSSWINPSSPTGAIISKYDSRSSDGVSYYMDLVDGTLRFAVFESVNPLSAVIIESIRPIPMGEFTHVTGVWNGGTDLALYVNGDRIEGISEIHGSIPSRMANNDVPVNLGRFKSSSGSFVGPFGFYEGLITAPQIYDRALTDEEIQLLHNGCAEAILPADPSLILAVLFLFGLAYYQLWAKPVVVDKKKSATGR